MNNIRSSLDVIATLAVIGACGVFIWNTTRVRDGVPAPAAAVPSAARDRSTPPTPPLPKEPLVLETAVTAGLPTATLGMVVFSDFQCPYCGRFAQDALPAIRKDYVDTGVLKLAFQHFPLEGIHSAAVPAAEAADCAARQGRFWSFHDALFTNVRDLGADALRRHATQTGLDLAAFDDCLSEDGEGRIRNQQRSGAELGVSGTPTVMLGRLTPDGRLAVSSAVFGAQPFERFKMEVDSLLAGG